MVDVPVKVQETLRSPFKESGDPADHVRGAAYTAEMCRVVYFYFVGDGAREVRLAIFYASGDVGTAGPP